MSAPNTSPAYFIEAGAAVLPGRVARVLHSRLRNELEALRMAALTAGDRQLYAALVGLREAALAAAPLPQEEVRAARHGEVAPEWMTSAQVAELLGLTQRAVRLALEHGRLRGSKDNRGCWQISRRDVHDYLNQKG